MVEFTVIKTTAELKADVLLLTKELNTARVRNEPYAVLQRIKGERDNALAAWQARIK